MPSNFVPLRLSRLRSNAQVRALLQENHLTPQHLIAPLFVSETIKQKTAIPSMPGQFQLSLNDLEEEIATISSLGIPGVILFGIPKSKDEMGSHSFSDQGIIQQALRKIKSCNKDLILIADICFCEYTSHGHCGALQDSTSLIDIDRTLPMLAKQAISLARAGADWVAPSGMTDGMVAAIRQGLDSEGLHRIPILSYAIKYCSSLYGPFREAAQGAPQFGDRKTYQLNPANANEALREVALDIQEGADLVMVKPAMFYLDIIAQVKQCYPQIPLCAFQVSGEYTMLKLAGQQNFISEKAAVLESLLSIQRAGADFIISYFAKDVGYWFKEDYRL